jgi:hypothetical protein
MRSLSPAWSLVVASALLAACGGDATPPVSVPQPPPAVTAAAASAAPVVASAAPSVAPVVAAVAGAGTPFSSMDRDKKLAHMKMVIQPTMGKLFTAYDGKKFGEFGCKTCHGEKKEDPHKALPKLTLSGDGFKKLFAEKPALMKFMTEQVTPAMQTAMGEPPFDPATHKGFGCGGCHTVQ